MNNPKVVLATIAVCVFISFNLFSQDGCCPDSIQYESQWYKTVLIGDQCWMAENLNIGDTIWENRGATDNGIIEKHCYNNELDSCNKYGGLYQWDEMMQYTTLDSSQGICPDGWHIPNDAEWTVLTGYVRSQPEYWCNSNSSWIGKSLAAKTNWQSSTSTCAVGNDLNSNNATSFSALPGGRYRVIGFFDVGNYGYWWTSTGNYSPIAMSRVVLYRSPKVSRTDSDKGNGFSVRCIKDDTICPPPPPPPGHSEIPFSPWAIGIGIILITVATVLRFRRFG